MSKAERVQAGIPVLLKDGTSRKVPRDHAELMIKTGEARRYISGTIYRAMQAGVEIKNFNDRDESGKLRELTRAAKAKLVAASAKQEKSEKKRQLPDKKNKNTEATVE